MSDPSKCPRCGVVYETSVTVCVHCGINLATGQKLDQQVEILQEEDREQPPRPHGLKLLARYIPALLPGLFRPKVLIISMLMLLSGLLMIILGVALALSMIFFEGMIIASVGVLAYAQTMAWLIAGELKMLPDALTDFDGAQWNMFTGAILIPIIAMFILIANRPEAP